MWQFISNPGGRHISTSHMHIQNRFAIDFLHPSLSVPMHFIVLHQTITNHECDDRRRVDGLLFLFTRTIPFVAIYTQFNGNKTYRVYGWRLLLWQFRKLSPTKLSGFVTMPINNRLIQFWLKANVELLVATCCLYQDDDAIVQLNMMHRQTDIWTRWRRACCTGQTHIIHSAPSNTDVYTFYFAAATAAAAVVVVTSFGSTNWSAHCDCNITLCSAIAYNILCTQTSKS